MSWTYSGRPTKNNVDAVRFLVGDTDSGRPVVSNEEIEYALSVKSNPHKAAVLVCRAIATKYSREASFSVGDVSKSCSDIAKAYADRAKELAKDSAGIVGFVLPSFGGLSHAEKETLEEDQNSVQPFFSRELFDE